MVYKWDKKHSYRMCCKLVIILHHYKTVTIIIITDLICFVAIFISNEASSSSKRLDQSWANDEKENDSFENSSAEGID